MLYNAVNILIKSLFKSAVSISWVCIITLFLIIGKATAQSPTISSFSPLHAKPGDVLNITGTNFNTVTTSNIVFFGATRAIVSTSTTTNLTVTVPTGATFAPLTVLNSSTNLAAYSLQSFIPTYRPEKTGITSNDFDAKQDFTARTSPYSVAIGDLDGDGRPDLAVVNINSHTVSILRNNAIAGSISASSFDTKVDFYCGSQTYPQSVAIGDLDGDGKPDLAIAKFGLSTVSVWRNTASSGSIDATSFATKVDFNTGAQPFSVAIGDLDGDGKPELAVANYFPNTVSVLRNTAIAGSITSGSFATKVDFTTGVRPWSIAIGDLDGDGKPELAVANDNSHNVSILHNTTIVGNITSGSFATKVDFETGSNPRCVAIGDLDGDGKPDLAVANSVPSTVSVLRNTSSTGSIVEGSFATKVDFTTALESVSLAMGDLDGDNKLDLAVVSFNPNILSVLRNTANSGSINSGSFATKIDFTTGSDPTSIAIGDLDGDGKPELVVANSGSASVSVYRNLDFNPDLSALVLSSGNLSPAFDSAITDYTSQVNNATNSITLTPTTVETSATIQVRVNGETFSSVISGNASNALSLNVGVNIIEVKITAQNSTTKTYTANITRAASSDATLSALSISIGTLYPVFSTAITAYAADVSHATTSVSMTPTIAEPNASIQIQVNSAGYSSTASGIASSALFLNVGSNSVEIKVTAQDGTTTKTYITTVTRAASTDATLSSMSIGSSTLEPAFASATTAYSTTVNYSKISVTVTPIITNSYASIEIQINSSGYSPTPSGTPSSSLALNEGSNTIDVKVTAQDGTTIIIYSTTIIRLEPLNISPLTPVICPGNSITMYANNCESTLSWTGGPSTLYGSSVIFSPSVATNYLVECSTGGSVTFKIEIASNTLAVESNVTTGNAWFKAVNTLTSDKVVGDLILSPNANVLYEAGGTITLLPGFKAEKSSIFKAEIKTCD